MSENQETVGRTPRPEAAGIDPAFVHAAPPLCARCGQPDHTGKIHHPINWVRCQFCYNHEFQVVAHPLISEGGTDQQVGRGVVRRRPGAGQKEPT